MILEVPNIWVLNGLAFSCVLWFSRKAVSELLWAQAGFAHELENVAVYLHPDKHWATLRCSMTTQGWLLHRNWEEKSWLGFSEAFCRQTWGQVH